ncbi:UNVERIFIED_CONTAM: hypothetical protein GTU68_015193 [Idotea baltica]|nr:hypothetical protein [Idotea baltica]
MSYSVKEIYYTIQGEGINAGRPAVFLRFSGCNFWNGLEKDREAAICNFCDTDFIGTDGVGGAKFSNAKELAAEVIKHWPKSVSKPFVVCTGGEPLLQLDTPLIEALHAKSFSIAIETNGSIEAPDGIDWITVSPKCEAHFIQRSGNEFKLVYPTIISPDKLENLSFDHYLLSPLWVEAPAERKDYLKQAINYCKGNPKWRLSVQQHKYWNIP